MVEDLKTDDLYISPIGNLKKLAPKLLNEKKIFDSLREVTTLLKIRSKAKKYILY